MRSRPLTFAACVAALTVVLSVEVATRGRQTAAPPRRLAIAAASDLQTALPQVVDAFERQATATATVSFGSSGTLFAQIQNGAPFDLFFSADVEYPRRLIAGGTADAGSLYEYARGRLVLWTRRDSGIDVSGGLDALASRRIRRIAIANPAFAPYGSAAMAALRAATRDDGIEKKIVRGENIAQTAQLVDSGNADVGLIALSLALGPALRARGVYVEVPASLHPPIEQAAVVVSASKNKALAAEFLAFLRRPESQALLARLGFSHP
jgi:molybdate transport system substrate-binding protein